MASQKLFPDFHVNAVTPPPQTKSKYNGDVLRGERKREIDSMIFKTIAHFSQSLNPQAMGFRMLLPIDSLLIHKSSVIFRFLGICCPSALMWFGFGKRGLQGSKVSCMLDQHPTTVLCPQFSSYVLKNIPISQGTLELTWQPLLPILLPQPHELLGLLAFTTRPLTVTWICPPSGVSELRI